ncbi:MAG TPA: hypothetical protein VMR21_03615 [Vicinamibacteria bacterium]|nr:hypothetical protein [Vicinamibacteria bacterium]
MTLFAREHLERLLAPHARPCLSLFMPTHRHRPGTEQDPIRFRNALKRAEGLLADRLAPAELRALLDPVTALSASEFWRHQRDGLAVFRSPDLAEHYRLPMALPELVVVADSFHVKPLLRFLQANRRYYVLALSQNRVTLYEGTPEAVSPVDAPGVPASLEEFLGEKPEAFLNLRTAGPGAALFHGHGAAEASRKEDLARFFRAVDRALWPTLREERAPLVLTGVGYHFPIYQEVSRYAPLLEQGVEGNVDASPPEEIHARVWPVVREAFRAREEEALEAHARAASRGLASTDLDLIGRMAVHGRVRQLLLAEGAHVWGALDPDSGAIARRPGQQDSRDDDVLDDLAEAVLARGGEVLMLAPERLPGGGPAAAVLRW